MFRQQLKKLGPAASKRLNHRMTYNPDPEKAKAFLSFAQHTEEHARGSTALWRNISIGCIPILAVCAYYVYGTEAKHVHHLEELRTVPDDQWPKEMEYQNIRSKKFYWGNGDKTLFWSFANHHQGHPEDE